MGRCGGECTVLENYKSHRLTGVTGHGPPAHRATLTMCGGTIFQCVQHSAWQSGWYTTTLAAVTGSSGVIILTLLPMPATTPPPRSAPRHGSCSTIAAPLSCCKYLRREEGTECQRIEEVSCRQKSTNRSNLKACMHSRTAAQPHTGSLRCGCW
jgi:hypothetical protein